MSEAIEIRFPGFGVGTLARVNKLEMAVVADFSAPPGRPLKGRFEAALLETELKVRGSRKLPDGRFLIEGRIRNQTCELRDYLASLSLEPRAL